MSEKSNKDSGSLEGKNLPPLPRPITHLTGIPRKYIVILIFSWFKIQDCINSIQTGSLQGNVGKDDYFIAFIPFSFCSLYMSWKSINLYYHFGRPSLTMLFEVSSKPWVNLAVRCGLTNQVLMPSTRPVFAKITKIDRGVFTLCSLFLKLCVYGTSF